MCRGPPRAFNGRSRQSMYWDLKFIKTNSSGRHGRTRKNPVRVGEADMVQGSEHENCREMGWGQPLSIRCRCPADVEVARLFVSPPPRARPWMQAASMGTTYSMRTREVSTRTHTVSPSANQPRASPIYPCSFEAAYVDIVSPPLTSSEWNPK